jgi:hypothetical protein
MTTCLVGKGRWPRQAELDSGPDQPDLAAEAMAWPSQKEPLQSVIVRTKPFGCRLGAEGRNQTSGALKGSPNVRAAVDGPVPGRGGIP